MRKWYCIITFEQIIYKDLYIYNIHINTACVQNQWFCQIFPSSPLILECRATLFVATKEVYIYFRIYFHLFKILDIQSKNDQNIHTGCTSAKSCEIHTSITVQPPFAMVFLKFPMGSNDTWQRKTGTLHQAWQEEIFCPPALFFGLFWGTSN